MHNSSNKTIEELKIKASLLLKALRSEDPNKIKDALARVNKISTLSSKPLSDFQHKDALEVIAYEEGFESWRKLRQAMAPAYDPAMLYIDRGFLHLWFANYHEAKKYQQEHGGYLFPYKSQFFVTSADYILVLGLDPNDPDWLLIDFDWVKPKEQKSWQNLVNRLVKACEKRNV